MLRFPSPLFIQQMSRTASLWAFVVVVLVAGSLGTSIYLQALGSWRQGLDGIVHDRNAHAAISMKMALALRQGNWIRLGSEIEKCRVWPPVFDLLAAFAMAVGGVDFRIGILPSLAGWMITVTLGFLAARRLFDDSTLGNFAGAMAVVFIAASPAHRIYATDMMLESLGAGLSMLAIYLYVVTRQQPSDVQDWRPLALALSVLFFEKYNYWMVVVLALIADGLWVSRQQYLSASRAIVRLPWRTMLINRLRQPRTYVFFCLISAISAVYVRSPISIELASHHISIRASGNLITLAYAIVLLCVVHELRIHWRSWWPHLGRSRRQLLCFHVLPIVFSFLLPHRLGAFLWYVRPNHYGEAPSRDLLGAASFYLRSAANDYHVGAWSLGIAVAAFAIAIVCHRRVRPGSTAVLFLAVIGAILVVIHPNQKSRFLHSWLPALWIGSAAGSALLLSLRPISGRRYAQISIAALLTGVLAYFHGSLTPGAGHSPELGHRHGDVSQFDLTDVYLPQLSTSKRIAFLSTMPCGGLAQSTYLQQYGRLEVTEFPILDQLTAQQLQMHFADWLNSTTADTVVMFDIPPGSYFYAEIGCNYDVYHRLLELLARQETFHLSRTYRMDRYGCSVTLWRRGNDTVDLLSVVRKLGRRTLWHRAMLSLISSNHVLGGSIVENSAVIQPNHAAAEF
jgi:hypothetical protein